jgi:hypothetical protein
VVDPALRRGSPTVAPIWEDLDFLRAQWTAGARPDDRERNDRRHQLFHGLRERELAIEEALV